MIVNHPCGHQSDVPPDSIMLGRIPCPECMRKKQPSGWSAAAATTIGGLIGHPIADGGWVAHHVSIEPPIVQGPPSRQQKRRAKLKLAQSQAARKGGRTRRERRALARQIARGTQ